jgi:hypothetical protein
MAGHIHIHIHIHIRGTFPRIYRIYKNIYGIYKNIYINIYGGARSRLYKIYKYIYIYMYIYILYACAGIYVRTTSRHVASTMRRSVPRYIYIYIHIYICTYLMWSFMCQSTSCRFAATDSCVYSQIHSCECI